MVLRFYGLEFRSCSASWVVLAQGLIRLQWRQQLQSSKDLTGSGRSNPTHHPLTFLPQPTEEMYTPQTEQPLPRSSRFTRTSYSVCVLFAFPWMFHLPFSPFYSHFEELYLLRAYFKYRLKHTEFLFEVYFENMNHFNRIMKIPISLHVFSFTYLRKYSFLRKYFSPLPRLGFLASLLDAIMNLHSCHLFWFFFSASICFHFVSQETNYCLCDSS